MALQNVDRAGRERADALRALAVGREEADLTEQRARVEIDVQFFELQTSLGQEIHRIGRIAAMEEHGPGRHASPRHEVHQPLRLDLRGGQGSIDRVPFAQQLKQAHAVDRKERHVQDERRNEVDVGRPDRIEHVAGKRDLAQPHRILHEKGDEGQ